LHSPGLSTRGITLRALIVVYALALLSVHIGDHWHLVHEDNGAMQTSLALSHVRYGLGVTRGLNVFIDPRSGARDFYLHHPPAVPLLLAGAFIATGHDSPAVARGVMVALSIATLLLLMSVLSELFADERAVLAGALAMATFPMESFFGRMVNYEVPALLLGLVQIDAYLRHRKTGSGASLVELAVAIVAGGLVEWASLLFSAAVAIAAFLDHFIEKRDLRALFTTIVAGAAVTAFNVAHIVVVRGSLRGLTEVVTRDFGVGHDPLTCFGFVGSQLENFRGYFTMSGLIATIVVVIALLWPRSRVAAALLTDGAGELRRFLLISLGAATAWVACSPNRARFHHYWQFYFLPFVVVAVALLIRWMLLRRHTFVIALIVLEVIASSSYKLYRRHSRSDEWAIANTRTIEEKFLSP